MTEKRFRISVAEAEAEALVSFLRGSGRVVVAGSYRRRRDTVGDLDLVVTAAHAAAVGDELVGYENRRGALLLRQGVPPHATYLFKHALVQDAAYSTLLREPRRALHARIAESLESQFAEMVEKSARVIGAPLH